MGKLINLGDIAYLLKPIVPLKLMFVLAKMQGKVRYLLNGKERSAVQNNFLDAFGQTMSESEINLMTNQFFEYKQTRGLMYFLFPKLKTSQIEKLFPIEGLEHLDRALSQKKGVVLLCSHLSSIINFVAKDILRAQGYDIRVALPEEEPPYAPTRFRKLIDSLSPSSNKVEQGGGMFFAQFNIRPIVRCLDENAVVILTGDGWHSASFVKTEFLGRTVFFATGAMSIARLTGASVVPLFVTGSPPEKMKIVIEEPVPVEKSENPKQDLEVMVEKYVRRLEYHVGQNIPCWEHWLHDSTLDKMAKLLNASISERYRM